MKQIQIGLCFFVEVVYNRIVINLPPVLVNLYTPAV